jgi:hypothetical protein
MISGAFRHQCHGEWWKVKYSKTFNFILKVVRMIWCQGDSADVTNALGTIEFTPMMYSPFVE